MATGNGTSNSGNLTVAGSNITANDVTLAAANQVNLQHTTNTDTTTSSNSSSGSSLGVGVVFGASGNGLEVSASASSAHGNGNSTAITQSNTHVTGANSVSITSGGDTNVIGAVVSGKQVTANVGGNLNVQSVQDTTVSAAHQSSAGGGFTISQGGGSFSFSDSHGNANGNYAGVPEQSGIQAGSGGFDVAVKGNTNLTGAYIGSTAAPDKNSLTTGTLTTSDIQDHSDYSASSSGFSAGAGVGVTGTARGPGSVSGAGGVTPMISQSDSGSQSATTKSGISSGTINITDSTHQTQALNTVNRDASNLNGMVSTTPNVQNLLTQQADLMNAASAAGQVVAQSIGAYADEKEKAAQASGDATAVAAWTEGGSSRALLQAAGGALIGGLGGGGALSAVGGAAGAGATSLLAGQLNSLEAGVASATGSNLLGNIAGNIVAGVGGALIGGSSDAAMASNVELYNQEADPLAQKRKKDMELAMAASGCSAISSTTCNPSIATTIINAKGANAEIALSNMQAAAPYVAGTLGVMALGPEALTTAATIGVVDYTGDVASYMLHLSTDQPNLAKSYATGVVGGLFVPFAVADKTIGTMSKAGVVAAGSYNAVVNGTAAFGTAAITNQSNPDLSGGVAAGTTTAGYVAQAIFPGPTGIYANKIIQDAAGIIQNIIQKSMGK